MALIPKYKPGSFLLLWGLSTLRRATPEMVLNLSVRSVSPKNVNRTFSLTANGGNFMYFASPVEFGPVQFLDTDSSFVGGWDGANDNPFEVYGPIMLDLVIEEETIPYYVYRTDYEDLGLCHWKTSPYVEELPV